MPSYIKTYDWRFVDVDALVSAREAARRVGLYGEADRIRGELLEIGVVIKDEASGPFWWRRSRGGA